MASYTRNIQMVKPRTRINSRFNRLQSNTSISGPPDNVGAGNNFASILPEIYAGHPQRVQRYAQYQQMDMDSDINSSLDTIADFSTQADETNNNLFQFSFDGSAPADVEVNILTMCLKKWTKLNEFQNRLWRILRNTLMYGDVFFVRDPETSKWLFIDPALVESIFVDRQQGKKIIAYAVRDLVVNEEALVASDQTQFGSNLVGQGTNTLQNNIDPQTIGGGAYSPNFNSSIQNLTLVKAEYMVHLSLSEGLDANWPFGTSFLESVYKPYRQKSLLEDAMLIYRIQRAPERRVFYIDTGELPPHKAAAYLEKVKNDTRQRRIPTRCLSLDTKIPLLDGRSLELSEIIEEYNNGKENWVYSCNPETGEIVPGPITWAGITGHDKKVMKLTLDNGETIVCTPEHKFPIPGKGFVKAEDLSINESFFPGYMKKTPITSKSKNTYNMIFDNKDKKWVFVHKLIANYFKDTLVKEYTHDNKNCDNKKAKTTVHHIDYNRYNNNPDNLVWMEHKDHFKFHSDNAKEIKANPYRKKHLDEVQYMTYDNKLLEMLTEIMISNIDNNRTLNQRKVVKQVNDDIDFINYYKHINSKVNIQERVVFGINHCKIMLKKLLDCSWSYFFNKLLEYFGFKNYIDFRNKFSLINHKLVKIEYLDNTYNVGTITVDGDEKYHNYHTFLLDSGIFTKNSGGGESVTSSAYNPLCLDMNTRIPLLDGRTLSIYELTEEYNNGKENWVYSCNPETGEIVPGNITWAGHTRKNAKVIKITLDNGETLTCTPDHKIPVRNKGFIEAQYITSEDSLFSFSNNNKLAQSRATMVGNFFKKITNHQILHYKNNNQEKNSIHFKDLNCSNIDPRNIQYMDNEDRILLLKNEYDIKSYEEYEIPTIIGSDKIISIEWLEDTMDVGTITVDGDERWHNFHTFAIESGIFVKNSMIEDYFFSQSSNGRGSKVTTLEGGDALSSIDDMRYFSNLLKRGLRVPASYLPTGPDDNGVVFNDGRSGTAYIQEFRFAEFCRRIQRLLTPVFNREFKRFVEDSGYTIDSDLYDIMFNPPQHFGEFARVERDVAMINTFTPLQDNIWMSKRFLAEKYLGWSKEDIARNEMMWVEEHPDETEVSSDAAGFIDQAGSSSVPGLDSIGIRDDSDISGESDMSDDESSPTADTQSDNLDQSSGLSADQE